MKLGVLILKKRIKTYSLNLKKFKNTDNITLVSYKMKIVDGIIFDDLLADRRMNLNSFRKSRKVNI